MKYWSQLLPKRTPWCKPAKRNWYRLRVYLLNRQPRSQGPLSTSRKYFLEVEKGPWERDCSIDDVKHLASWSCRVAHISQHGCRLCVNRPLIRTFRFLQQYKNVERAQTSVILACKPTETRCHFSGVWKSRNPESRIQNRNRNPNTNRGKLGTSETSSALQFKIASHLSISAFETLSGHC